MIRKKFLFLALILLAKTGFAAVDISEILPNPTGTDSGNETAEIRNSGADPVNLSGWTIGDTTADRITIDDKFVLPAGGSHTFTFATGVLTNTGDTVILKDNFGNVVDSYTYTSSTEGFSINTDDGSTNNTPTPTSDGAVDSTAPTLSSPQITTPTNDSTPEFQFDSDEAGTISYSGSCTSSDSVAVAGTNTITFNSLADGTYSDCKVSVADVAENSSDDLDVPTFEVDTAAPTLTSVSISSNNSLDSALAKIGDTISIDFTASDPITNVSVDILGRGASVSNVSGNSWAATLILNGTETEGAVSFAISFEEVSPPNVGLSVASTTDGSGVAFDSTAPTLGAAQIDALTNDSTPNFQFDSDEVGTISYSGSCTSSDSAAVAGTNTITFDSLADGIYSDCKVSVADSAGNVSADLSVPSFEIDTTAPTLSNAQITTPTADSTPDFTFDSDEAGTINYSGVCTSADSAAVAGTNTITFDSLADGTYSACEVAVVDSVGNVSANLGVPSFLIDTTAPVFSSISVSSDNLFDPNYAAADSTITFSLTLAAADTFSGTGQIDFLIGTTLYSTPISGGAQTSPQSVYSADFALSSVSNLDGAITISNINFTDQLGHSIDLSAFSAGSSPSPTVLVDTTAPALDSAGVSTSNPAATWAKSGDEITYSLAFSEDVKLNILNSASTANNASALKTDFDLTSFATSDSIIFKVQNGDNGAISLTNADFQVVDRAGNEKNISETEINALFSNTIQADTEVPTISDASISSNNALDTSLAKTNDTITISFTSADNLSPSASLAAGGNILNQSITASSVGTVGGAQSVSRFTDGSENSETVVSFSFAIADEAGNISAAKTSTDDGSSVRFDRTNPVVSSVSISAVSADSTAYLGDAPKYYAKNGDSITLQITANDYVDILDAPSGTFFGQSVSLTNTSGSVWETTLNGISGTEGEVEFDILVRDNAGNGDGTTNAEVRVTGTTDGSSVIFDTTSPSNPTLVQDKKGAETADFKHRVNAEFNWSGASDSGSGLQTYFVQLQNAENGYDESAEVAASASSHDFYEQAELPPADLKYEFSIQTRDKSGNDSAVEMIYEQNYSIGLIGSISDSDGNAVSNVRVQVVAAFGDTCNTGANICTATTDSAGDYDLVLQKDRTYIVTYFRSGYFLQKNEQKIGQVDTSADVNLEKVQNPKLRQTTDQTLRLSTSSEFERSGRLFRTQLEVLSTSGEVSVSQISGGLLISSFGEILSVRTNNPNLEIVDNFDNTFSVLGNTGSVIDSGSLAGIESRYESGNSSITGRGLTRNYTSGSSRIGVIEVVAGGKANLRSSGMARGSGSLGKELVSYQQSQILAAAENAPIAGQIKKYTNRNGFKIFAGYQSGKIGLERFENSRLQNRLKFRGTSSSQSLESRYSRAKTQFQKSVEIEAPKNRFARGIRKRKPGQEINSAIARKAHLAKKENEAFARKNLVSTTRTPSQITGKNPRTIKIKIGNKSVSMAEVYSGKLGGR